MIVFLLLCGILIYIWGRPLYAHFILKEPTIMFDKRMDPERGLLTGVILLTLFIIIIMATIPLINQNQVRTLSIQYDVYQEELQKNYLSDSLHDRIMSYNVSVERLRRLKSNPWTGFLFVPNPDGLELIDSSDNRYNFYGKVE